MNPYAGTSEIFSATNIFLLYNASTENIAINILKLNDSIAALNDSISKLLIVNSKNNLQSANALNEQGTRAVDAQRIVPDNVSTKLVQKQVQNDNDIVKKLSETTDKAAELLEGAGLSKIAEKTKKISKGITAAADATDALTALSNSGNFAEVITNTIKVLGLVEGIAGAISAVGGMYGRLIGAGVLLGSAAIAHMQRKSDSEQIPQSDFMSEGLKKKNPYLVKLQQSNENAIGLAEIVHQKTEVEIQKEKKVLVGQFLKKSGTIIFDDTKAIHDPVYALAVAEATTQSLQMKKRLIDGITFNDAADQNAFQRSFDPLNLLPTSVLPGVTEIVTKNFGIMTQKKPVVVSVKEHREHTEPHKFIGQVSPENVLQQTVTDLIRGYSLYGDKYVSEYADKMKQKYGDQPWFKQRAAEVSNRFNKAKSYIDKNTIAMQHVHGGQPSDKGNTSGNTINFNKALIEHFTINVRDGKDAITDFKRKVEEVLLEILNSVNTTH